MYDDKRKARIIELYDDMCKRIREYHIQMLGGQKTPWDVVAKQYFPDLYKQLFKEEESVVAFIKSGADVADVEAAIDMYVYMRKSLTDKVAEKYSELNNG
jgi:hypothetical protein